MKKLVFPAFIIGAAIGTTVATIGYIATKERGQSSDLEQCDIPLETCVNEEVIEADTVVEENNLEISNDVILEEVQQGDAKEVENSSDEVENFDADAFIIDEDVEEIFSEELNLYEGEEEVEEYRYEVDPSLVALEKLCESLVEKIS